MDGSSRSGEFYTTTEDALILEQYPVVGAVGLVPLLGRPARSINRRAAQIGALTPRAWIEEDDSVILTYYPTLGAKGVQPLLSVERTLKAIGLRAKRLGVATRQKRVTCEAHQSPALSPPNGWTSEEDQILHAYAGRLSLKDLHSRFFTGDPNTRSYGAVAQRLCALGLTEARPRRIRLGASAPLSSSYPWTAPMLDEVGYLVRNHRSLQDIQRAFPNVPKAEVALQVRKQSEVYRPNAPTAPGSSSSSLQARS